MHAAYSSFLLDKNPRQKSKDYCYFGLVIWVTKCGNLFFAYVYTRNVSDLGLFRPYCRETNLCTSWKHKDSFVIAGTTAWTVQQRQRFTILSKFSSICWLCTRSSHLYVVLYCTRDHRELNAKKPLEQWTVT